MSLQKFLDHKAFNWEVVLKAAKQCRIRLVTFCIYDPNEPDPECKERVTMSPAMFLAMVHLNINPKALTFDGLFVGYNVSEMFKIEEKMKELSWMTWKTAPPIIKNQKTSYEINHLLEQQRYAKLNKQYSISVPEEGGHKHISENGVVKLFHSPDGARSYLTLTHGLRADEIDEAIRLNQLNIGIYQ